MAFVAQCQSNTYTLTLAGNGFTSYVIDANTRITGRNAASQTGGHFGIHGSGTNSTIIRNGITNLNTSSFDYAPQPPANFTVKLLFRFYRVS